MAPADLPAVMAIAAVVHPDYPEDEAVFAERLRLAPDGCHVLAGEDGALKGYLVSHPWPAGTVPALNSRLGEIPQGVANWYLHDLALLPGAWQRRGGRDRRGDGSSCRRNRPYEPALVAVNDSTGFWRRQGFREVHDPALDRKLASYDDAACYMRRELND